MSAEINSVTILTCQIKIGFSLQDDKSTRISIYIFAMLDPKPLFWMRNFDNSPGAHNLLCLLKFLPYEGEVARQSDGVVLYCLPV
jgi:hypothetical protein